MIENNEQYRASQKAAKDLEAWLAAPADPKLSEKFVADSRNKIKRKLTEIKADISDYEKKNNLQS